MYRKYEFYKNIGFFNEDGLDLVVYYDPKYNKLIALEEGARILKRYVKTPYDSFKYRAMQGFWNTLDGKHRALADSYTERRGFFQFMHETGLIDFYNEAYAAGAEEFVLSWEAKNHLNIDWDSIIFA